MAPLGRPVVPEVNWMLCTSVAPDGSSARRQVGPRRVRPLLEVGPGPPAGPGRSPSAINRFKRGKRADDQSREVAAADLGTERLDHRHEVRALERAADDRASPRRPCARASCELVEPIGRVDVDQHGADSAGGQLGHDPFRHVHRPDADVLAGLDAQRDQRGGDLVDPLVQLAPRPAQLRDRERPGHRDRDIVRPCDPARSRPSDPTPREGARRRRGSWSFLLRFRPCPGRRALFDEGADALPAPPRSIESPR